MTAARASKFISLDLRWNKFEKWLCIIAYPQVRTFDEIVLNEATP